MRRKDEGWVLVQPDTRNVPRRSSHWRMAIDQDRAGELTEAIEGSLRSRMELPGPTHVGIRDNGTEVDSQITMNGALWRRSDLGAAEVRVS